VGRLLVILMAVAVAAVSVVVSRGDEQPGAPDASKPSASTVPAGALRIQFAYSPEKEHLIAPLVDGFNASRATSGGRAVHIDAQVINSGDVEAQVVAGRLQPDVWSPASSLWARLLDYEADRRLTPRTSPSIVRTPLVIAMWEPEARALGWPSKPIGFSDLMRLARSRPGFKLVHTNPDFSTSGLEAVVAEYYAASGRTGGLSEREVTRSSARDKVRNLERSIVHYGENTLLVSQRLKEAGPAYASAGVMEEVTLLDFNRTRGDQQPLVAVYPKEGTFFSDSPFVVLDAPWVSAEERRAAEVFRRYLTAHITPELAARFSFRPPRDIPPVGSSISKANGADPSLPRRVLQLPDPPVLAAIKHSWRRDRKPANILLVVDVSDSMRLQQRLDRAKAGLRAFLREAQPQDSVGMLPFAYKPQPLVPIRPMTRNRTVLRSAIDGLVTHGGTAIYDAVDRGVRDVEALGSQDHINALVLLTDGQDSSSQLVAKQVIDALAAKPESSERVRVFTIAYSPEAAGSREILARIAAASGGDDYLGQTEDIESVYRKIASFF
jgi:Ca-activated chloride channel family protein